MKSFCAFCTGVMTLVAASSLVVSCYDDSDLRAEIENVKGELDGLDARLKAIEGLKDQLAALTARVDALYTLQFQVSDANELQYSFDGKDWKGTGIILAGECDCPEPTPPCDCTPVDPCTCPEVSLVDNGDSVTIKIGDAEFTIEKPQEIVFELRAGKLYFESEGTMTVNIKSSGIEDVTVMAAPKGWWAEINSDGKVEITAPDYATTQPVVDYETWEETPGENAANGFVKVHACGADGKCMVGKIAVEVTDRPVVVKAYGGNAYFEAAGNFPAAFYYGACLRSQFEAEVAPLLKSMNAEGYSNDYPMNGDGWDNLSFVEAPLAELIGEEPALGEEYVVWALVEDYNKMEYTMADFIVAYYSPILVTAVEDEAARTAYNVTVTVNVEGADSYYAVAIPENYAGTQEEVDSFKEQLVMSLDPSSWSGPMGKLYTDSYTGSVLDIAEGTSSSMSGNYAPNRKIYLLILPMDGRNWTDYTVEDVKEFSFMTSELTSGGSVNLSAKQVTEYMGKVYDYDIWDYVEKLVKLDPYTEVGVEVTPSSTSDWSAFYYQFLTVEQWADYGAYEEDLVDLLLEGWGMTPNDVEKWPAYLTEKVDPATTVHFVGFIVDKAGKYGELAHVELTSAELKKADFEWTEPYTTNLIDGVLKNSQTLQFTPKFEGGAEPASYKYVLTQTMYYNKYEGMDDAKVAEELFFSTSSDVKSISAEELANGILYVEGHTYGYPYYFAIVPIDAEGNPGASAAILEYDCVFSMDSVVTEGADFEATAPVISINFPDESEFYPDNGWGDASYYGYAYSSYDQLYQFYYEINFDVTPAEGTEVCAVLVDAESYDLTAEANVKAGSAWSGSYGSWGTVITNEATSASHKYYNHYENAPAPDIVLVVSWYDAEGTYYYREYPLQEKFQYYADLMLKKIYGDSSEPELSTPDGKQLTFTWADMMDAPAVLDFGVTTSGKLAVAYDMLAVYGEDAGIPEEMRWMQYLAWDYEITANDATSGVITISSVDHFGDVQTTEGTYSEWNGETCLVTIDVLMLENVTMTVAADPIPVYIEQGGMIM